MIDLSEWAKSHNLTAYQIGQQCGSTPAEQHAIKQRWQRWLTLGRSPKVLELLQEDLAKMGYRLRIEKIE